MDDSHNYIIGLIDRGDFDAAKRALEYDLDPSITYRKENALDFAKSRLSSKTNSRGQKISYENLEKLSALIKTLEEQIADHRGKERERLSKK